MADRQVCTTFSLLVDLVQHLPRVLYTLYLHLFPNILWHSKTIENVALLF